MSVISMMDIQRHRRFQEPGFKALASALEVSRRQPLPVSTNSKVKPVIHIDRPPTVSKRGCCLMGTAYATQYARCQEVPVNVDDTLFRLPAISRSRLEAPTRLAKANASGHTVATPFRYAARRTAQNSAMSSYW